MTTLILGSRKFSAIVRNVAVLLAIVIGAVLAPAAVGSVYVIAAIVSIGLVLACAAHPKFAILLWLLSACFLPFWVGVENPFYLPASSLVGLLVLGASFVKNKWRVGKVDAAVLLFCALCLVCGVVGLSRPGDVTNVITQWLLSFVVGRLLVQRAGISYTYRAIACVFSAAALCSLVEFFFDWNPYYGWVVDNTQYLAWGHEQDRGGIVRAEWAFGHSIALGCALAMAIPVTFSCNFRPSVRAALIAALLGGAVVSFSRSGMISAVFALLLSLFFFSDKERSRGRLAVVFVLGAVAWFAIPKILSVFAEEGRRATISSDYRLTLIDLIPSMNPLGLAKGYTEPSQGEFYFQGFKSIDSTFILLGVSFGFVVALLALVGVGWLTWRVVSRTSSAPAISVLAVVPALFTVALITQFGSIFWFFLGVLSLNEVVKTGKEDSLKSTRLDSGVKLGAGVAKTRMVDYKMGMVGDV